MEKDLSEEEAVAAMWQAVNDLWPQLNHLPEKTGDQVISALLGFWASQYNGPEDREKRMQWAVDGARSMAKLVDAGAIKPHLMGIKGNA